LSGYILVNAFDTAFWPSIPPCWTRRWPMPRLNTWM